jgi:hypothetical protein
MMRPTTGAARLRAMRRRLSLLRERAVPAPSPAGWTQSAAFAVVLALGSGGTPTGFVMLVIVLLMFSLILNARPSPPVRA